MMYKEHEIEEIAPWLVILITLFGAFLRVYQLGRDGFLLDETVNIWMAQHNAADLLRWTFRIGQNPPLYDLVLHSWIGLNGDTPYSVRLLSALFGAGAIPVIYLTGKRISGEVMGLAAAVLLSLSLFHINLAREAGLYTFLTFNAAVAVYALVRLMTDPRAARPIGSQFRDFVHAWRTLGPIEPDTKSGFSYQDGTRNQSGWRGWIFRHRWSPIKTVETDLAWIAYIVFSAETLLSHNTAVFFFLATNLVVLGLMLSRRIKPAFQAPSPGNWLKAQVGILLLWSPWAFGFIQQISREDQVTWLPKLGWDTVIQTLRAFLDTSAPDQASQVMTWILCAVLCLGLVYYRKKLSIFVFLVVLFAIPVLGELIVSMGTGLPIFDARTLIWITIPLFLALAAGIAQFRFHLLILFVLGIFGTYNLFLISDNYKVVQNEDWNDPAGYVANRVKKDDLILFNSAMAQIPFDYYFIPFEEKNYLEVVKHGVPDMFVTGIPELRVTKSDIPGLIALLSGHSRVWLVSSDAAHTDPEGLVPQTLAGRMRLIQTRDYFGRQVLLYASP